MKKDKQGCIGVILFLALCGSLFGNVILLMVAVSGAGGGGSTISSSARTPKFAESRIERGYGDGKIVQIDLTGIISSRSGGVYTDSMVDDLKIALKQARDDDKVSAVVLNIDSPGGEVTASDVIYNAIAQVDEVKPVVIYMNSVAASGGYYAACGGRYLMANPTTITGSIGVIIQTLNYEDMFGKVGLDSIVFKSGKFKDILSGSREMTEEEKQYIQALVMQTYDRFVGIVAEERELPKASLVNGVADGRIVSGLDALEAKLIDGVGYIEDAYVKARELAGVDGAEIVRYTVPVNLGNLLRLFGESDTTVEVDLLGGRLPKLESGKLYYLPGIYAP